MLRVTTRRWLLLQAGKSRLRAPCTTYRLLMDILNYAANCQALKSPGIVHKVLPQMERIYFEEMESGSIFEPFPD